MTEIFLTIFFISVLLFFLGSGIWVALSMIGVSAIGMMLFTSRPVGNLGSALAHYGGFQERGFGVVGLFDDDPKKINKQIAGLVVKPTSDIKSVCEKYNVAIGIIATPGKVAQEIADQLVDCGVKSILNFAPVLLKNIPDVQIRSVDLSQELQILSYYLERPVLKAVK